MAVSASLRCFLLQGRYHVFVSWVTDWPTAPLQPPYPPLVFLSYLQTYMQLDSAKWKSCCERWLCFRLPIDWESGWALEPVQTFRRRSKSLAFAGIRTPDRPARNLISIPITLSRFRTPVGYVTENNCRRSKHVRDLALGPTVFTYHAVALRISWISDGRGKPHKSVTDIGDGGSFTHQRHLWYTRIVYTISCKYNVHTPHHEWAVITLTHTTKRFVPGYCVVAFESCRCISYVSPTANEESFPRPPVPKLIDKLGSGLSPYQIVPLFAIRNVEAARRT